jgi:glyoxylase-like metal-dependent hydrolase (beta-lactamase superfamily II)
MLGSDLVRPLDLEHLGRTGAITAWLVLGDEPAVVDPGPATTLETLERGLARHGVAVEDLRHLVLTHVHLDHAGATGHLVGRCERVTVHLHEDGAPHLVEPRRLVASTRRTFGEAHDRLWGEVRPVPAARIRAWRPGDALRVGGLRPFATPGHIGHHLSWLHESSGTLLAGDALGIVLAAAGPTHPPTPPPAVDLRAWEATRVAMEAVDPARMGVAHAGLHDCVRGRIADLGARLDALEARVRRAVVGDRVDDDARAYEGEVRAEHELHLPPERVKRYFDVFRAETDYRGVVRYVRKSLEP